MNHLPPSESDSRDPHGDPRSLDSLVASTEGLQPWRRVLHACTGIMLAFVPVWFDWPKSLTLTVLAGAFVGLYCFDWLRLRSESVNRVFFGLFKLLASPREAAGPASSTWYALGAFLAWALYPPEIASASILVLALADPAAGVVGRLFGRRPLGKGSVEGTVTFFLVASVSAGFLIGWPAALIAAAVAALLEIVPGLVDDNLVIPVVTGAVLWLILHGLS